MFGPCYVSDGRIGLGSSIINSSGTVVVQY